MKNYIIEISDDEKLWRITDKYKTLISASKKAEKIYNQAEAPFMVRVICSDLYYARTEIYWTKTINGQSFAS